MDNGDIESLKKLSEETKLSQVELMTRILHSGINAIVDNGYRLHLPLKFALSETALAARSTTPKPSRK